VSSQPKLQCTNCDSIQSADSKFCSQCGTQLQAGNGRRKLRKLKRGANAAGVDQSKASRIRDRLRQRDSLAPEKLDPTKSFTVDDFDDLELKNEGPRNERAVGPANEEPQDDVIPIAKPTSPAGRLPARPGQTGSNGTHVNGAATNGSSHQNVTDAEASDLSGWMSREELPDDLPLPNGSANANRNGVAPNTQQQKADQSPAAQPPVSDTPVAEQAPAAIPIPVPIPQAPIPQTPVPQAAPIPAALPTVATQQTTGTDGPNKPSESAESGRTKPPAVAIRQDQATDSASSDSRNVADRSDTTVTDDDDDKARQKQQEIAGRQAYEATRDRLAQAIEQSQNELFRLQQSIPQKIPRGVARIVAALEETSLTDTEQLVSHIRALGRTHSAAALETIRGLCESVHKDIRLACVQSLGQIAHTSSSIALLDMLKDKVPEITEESIRALLQTEHREQVLPAALAAGLVNVRFRAVLQDTVLGLDDAAKESLQGVLTQSLDSEDCELTAIAISLLSRLGAEDLTRRFVKLAGHDDEQVRAASVEALAFTEDKQVVRHLNAAMKDESAWVRSIAAGSFSKIRSPRSEDLLIKALADPEVIVRRAAAKTLSRIEDAPVSEAASQAIRTETDPATIERLLEMLGRAGSDEAMDTLARYINGDDRDLKHRAISTLRRLKNPKAVRQLVPLIADNDTETRRLAIEAVGRLGDKKVCSRLRELLKTDSDESIRAVCARALGDLKDEGSLSALEEALHDGRNVRCQVVISLGQIAKKESIPVLLAQLKDAAPEIRYHACNALGQIGEASCSDALRGMLEDNDAMVRRGAESALEKLGVKTSGTAWTRNARRTFRRVVGRVLPDVAAGGVPVGTLGLGLAAVLLVAGVGYGAMQLIARFTSGSGAYSGPVSFVASATINPDGSRIAVLRERGILETWDTSEGTLTSRFKYDTRTNRVIFADEDDVLLCTKDGLKEWHLITDPYGNTLSDVSNDDVAIVQKTVVLPDGKTAYMFTRRDVNVMDLAARKTLRSFQLPVLVPPSLTVGPDQRFMIYGDDKGYIHVLSAQDGKEQQKFSVTRFLNAGNQVQPKVENLAFSHDGKYLAIGFDTGHLQIWDMETAEPIKTQVESSPVAKMTFHPTEHRLIFVNREGVHILSEGFETRQSIDPAGMGNPMGIQMSSDGRTLLAFADEVRDVWVFDLEGRQLKHHLKGKTN
jgi:HEAT repeat protein